MSAMLSTMEGVELVKMFKNSYDALEYLKIQGVGIDILF